MRAQTEGPEPFRVETIELDLPALAGAFSQRLRACGLPVSAEHAAGFAHALTLVQPVSRTRLYWTARAVFVSEPADVKHFDAAFASVFGSQGGHDDDACEARMTPAPADDRPGSESRSGAAGTPEAPQALVGSSQESRRAAEPDAREVEVPLAPSDEELLRGKRFEALSARELAQLYELMARLRLATPSRRTRRAEQYRHGERIDLRRTLRSSMRTGGEPLRLRRRRRRVLPRRLVLLCDISGSMEPYARAHLQFLTCAAGASRRPEAFVFATRLTRVTRALTSGNPERAIQNAAAAAPDWSSGTRIGDALKLFNDSYGRRGLARGSVVVILSDGWERGDPALVGQEMERLARLAHRIVWVNPRAAAEGFVPRAGGMAAALPHCDALVSGHSLDALGEVIEAIGAERYERPPVPAEAEPAEEPWASATPVAGSSVPMPSGYGPSRGRTTPGWTS